MTGSKELEWSPTMTAEEEVAHLLALIDEDGLVAFCPPAPYKIIHDEFEEGGRWYNLEHKTVRNTENGLMFGWTVQVGATEYQENEYPKEVFILEKLEPITVTYDVYGSGKSEWSRIERKDGDA